MKFLRYTFFLAVLVAGAMALNNYAIKYDAHQAVDRLADRYNTCYTCDLPGPISGGKEINALTRAGVRNMCNISPKELHHLIDFLN